MMNQDILLHELEKHDISPTAIRILVLKTMHSEEYAVSLSDLEAKMLTVDKSSIFRTLTLFLKHHLVHCIDDGSGSLKYALCSPGCHCGEGDEADMAELHTHFYCEKCHRTFCLRGLPVPMVKLPKDFKLHTANYVLKGLCPECTAKQNSGNG